MTTISRTLPVLPPLAPVETKNQQNEMVNHFTGARNAPALLAQSRSSPVTPRLPGQ